MEMGVVKITTAVGVACIPEPIWAASHFPNVQLELVFAELNRDTKRWGTTKTRSLSVGDWVDLPTTDGVKRYWVDMLGFSETQVGFLGSADDLRSLDEAIEGS